MSVSGGYWVGLARPVDAEPIYALVFENPDTFVRRITREELAARINGGVCWVARGSGPDGPIVAVCLITVPETLPGVAPDPAEFGGLFVGANLRGNGLGTSLATFALASYFWDNDADSPFPLSLIAHVHVDNPKPRPLLAKLKFSQRPRTIVVPNGILGFEHMPKNADGKVEGHEFEYPPTERIRLFRWTADLLERGSLKSGEPVDLDVPIGMTPEALRELATLLEGPAR